MISWDFLFCIWIVLLEVLIGLWGFLLGDVKVVGVYGSWGFFGLVRLGSVMRVILGEVLLVLSSDFSFLLCFLVVSV